MSRNRHSDRLCLGCLWFRHYTALQTSWWVIIILSQDRAISAFMRQ